MTTTTEYATWTNVHGLAGGRDAADHVTSALGEHAATHDVDRLVHWYIETINDRLPDDVRLVGGATYIATVDAVPHLTHEQLRDAEPDDDEFWSAAQSFAR